MIPSSSIHFLMMDNGDVQLTQKAKLIISFSVRLAYSGSQGSGFGKIPLFSLMNYLEVV